MSGWPKSTARTHRRQYRKLHLAMNTASGDIPAVEFTSSREGDSPVPPELLDQIPDGEEISTVISDGAFDTRRCHSAILARALILVGQRGSTSWRRLLQQRPGVNIYFHYCRIRSS